MSENGKRKYGKDERSKHNVLKLVKALLLVVKGDFALDESELKAAVKVEWVSENTLKVSGEYKKKAKRGERVFQGTTKEALWQLAEKTGNPLELPQRQRENALSNSKQRQANVVPDVFYYLEELGVWQDERPENKKNTPYWIFTLKLKHKDASIDENLGVVQQKLQIETSPQTTDKSNCLRDICRKRLEKQKQLTTNRLMHTEAMVFNLDDIDVDLALVERKKPDKRSGDDRPEQSRLYQPDDEETEKLEYRDFLAKILESNQSNKIAVIGEPGAGKTTLLQRIAFEILRNTKYFPIWIPLGNLPNPAPQLKEYLLNRWLEDAIFSVTPEIRANFEQQLTDGITDGNVWLLLDGVDEMAASDNPLTFIDQWIPDWGHNLPVMLTCRMNVWEENPYALYGFQTYRTWWFSEEKVKKFIHDGFQKSDPALGVQLQEALNQPGKKRIKDLVKNPLRLMLLCSIWHFLDGKLPDTKAELYQQYVEKVYRWKENKFPTTPERQKQLTAKLGELAKEAIDKQENRFCLRMEFVEALLGESSLFELALKVGWLNQVGVDERNPFESVYAFYHPTFQEYFAATAIDDWDFFLPRQHQDKPVANKYRILSPHWKEVFLMWLGRKHVKEMQKEELLNALENFKDGCGGFYHYRANFIAAAGIAEFRKYSKSEALVTKIGNWSVGDFTNQQSPNILTPQPSQNIWSNPVQQAALVALQETDRSMAMQSNNNQESDLQERNNRRLVAPTTRENVDRIIEEVRELPNDSPILWKAIETLGEITSLNKDQLINAINFLLSCTGDKYISSMKRKQDDLYIGWKAIYHLFKIVTITYGEGEEKEAQNTLNVALQNILKLTDPSNLFKTYLKLAQASEKQKIVKLVGDLYASNDENKSIKNFEELASILQEPELFRLMVKALKNYLTNQENRDDNSNNSSSISDDTLSELHLDGYTYEDRFNDCYKTIWYSAQALSYPDFYEAWHFG